MEYISLTKEQLIAEIQNLSNKNIALSERLEKTKSIQKELLKHKDILEQKLNEIVGSDDVDYDIKDILNADEFQRIADLFYNSFDIPLAILDTKGNILVAVGWVDACTKFHRVNPESCVNCHESDNFLNNKLKTGEYRAYKCKNGLNDVVTPIVVNNKHIANLFIGQFFAENEVIDEQFFINQAHKYNYDVDAYMDAIHRVPIFSIPKIQALLKFYQGLAYLISKLSYNNLKLSKLLVKEIVNQQNIKESEEKYKIIFENMTSGLALLEIINDENGTPVDLKIVEANKAIKHLLGLSHLDHKTLTYKQIFHYANNEWFQSYIDVATNGGNSHFEYFSDRTKKHFEVIAFSPQKNQVVIIINDITQRKETELSMSEKLSSLTQPTDDTSNISIFDLFDINEIQAIQDAFSEATGVASIITDIDGTPFTKPSNFCRLCNDIIRNTEKGRVNCYHSDAEIGRRNITGPIVQRCLSGSLWDAGSSISVGDKHIANWLIGQVLEEGNNYDKMMEYADIIGADKVEYRKALKEVTIMSKEKFEKVSHALFLISRQLSRQALHNLLQGRYISKLKEAEEIIKIQVKELENKNAELEKFTYTVSHDLKSPLITIKGFVGILNEDIKKGKPERIEQDIARISNAADKMNNLLQDLLNLSRIGRMINPSNEFRMSDVVKEAIELLQGLISEKNVKIEFDDPMPLVFADKLRIREVWQNLIENAIKYSNKPDIILNIGNYHSETDPVYYIKDNGIGIDMRYKDKIFALFDKLDQSSDGTGIGLSLVKRIIELHNGTIWVESDGYDCGSTFYFTIKSIQKHHN